jgi:hypothetical protein
VDAVLKDPGERLLEERNSLLDANPELQKLLKRKEKLDMRKLMEKKEAKRLTDAVVMKEVRIKDKQLLK